MWFVVCAGFLVVERGVTGGVKKYTRHTPCVPECNLSFLLARGAEQLGMSRIPRNVVNLSAMRAGELGSGSRFHLSCRAAQYVWKASDT